MKQQCWLLNKDRSFRSRNLQYCTISLGNYLFCFILQFRLCDFMTSFWKYISTYTSIKIFQRVKNIFDHTAWFIFMLRYKMDYEWRENGECIRILKYENMYCAREFVQLYRVARASLFTILKTRLRASFKMYFKRSRPIKDRSVDPKIDLFKSSRATREHIMKRGCYSPIADGN